MAWNSSRGPSVIAARDFTNELGKNNEGKREMGPGRAPQTLDPCEHWRDEHQVPRDRRLAEREQVPRTETRVCFALAGVRP